MLWGNRLGGVWDLKTKPMVDALSCLRDMGWKPVCMASDGTNAQNVPPGAMVYGTKRHVLRIRAILHNERLVMFVPVTMVVPVSVCMHRCGGNDGLVRGTLALP